MWIQCEGAITDLRALFYFIVNHSRDQIVRLLYNSIITVKSCPRKLPTLLTLCHFSKANHVRTRVCDVLYSHTLAIL